MKKTIIAISIFLVGLLFIFYFFPTKEIPFIQKRGNANFSLEESKMQFYSNMRFPSKNISYRISDCILKKQNDMELAFSIMENTTLLNFYPVSSNEEIFISCDEGVKSSEGGLFIAGEGGPTTIISGNKFNIILDGKILLIKKSDCATPNVALHELLHVLGFLHSNNSNNIMYNVTNCRQVIGEDVLSLINELYSVPTYSDLAFENISVTKRGAFLDVNFTVLNYGLIKSGNFSVDIYSENSLIKNIPYDSIDIGSGRTISIKNIFTLDEIKKIIFEINSNFYEINKENNKIELEIAS